MVFNSLEFITFFPIAFIVALILPGKGPFRHIWLHICSYFFYMCWDPRYIVLIMFTTIVTFISGFMMDRGLNGAIRAGAPGSSTATYGSEKGSAPAQKTVSSEIESKSAGLKKSQIHTPRRRFWVAFAFICNLSVLFYFKYVGFFLDNVIRLMGIFKEGFIIEYPSITLPVGISFFTFQALSYTMDVYRRDIEPERNLFRYALYVSFFPQLVAGPIERSGRLLSQLRSPIRATFDKAVTGIFYMLWGYFQKVVLADRIAIYVDTVYGDVEYFGGAYLIVATILFAFQIYCDFGGYSSIARGAALFFGIDLMENFNAPYLSGTVAEFWRRWHISLSSWLRDYLYIPLGGSRRGKTRKYINLMIVFFASGLWHGARWSFVTWGCLNGLYQIVGEQLRGIAGKLLGRQPSAGSIREKGSLAGKAGIARLPGKVISTLITFILVDFTWIFFRSSGMEEALKVIKSIFTVHNFGIITDGSLFNCGLSKPDFLMMLACVLILIIADILKYNGVNMIGTLQRTNPVLRGAVAGICLWAILLFGVWGSAYDASGFIYFAF